MEPLPHRYPFRFVDRTIERTGTGGGRVSALLTAGGRAACGGPLSAGLVGELMAQAALLLSGGGPEPVGGSVLAGFSDLVVESAPEPGETLTVRVGVAGRVGPVVKFEAAVHGSGGGRVASGTFTIRQETSSPESAT